MPRFRLTITQDHQPAGELEVDLKDLEAAAEEGRRAVVEVALDAHRHSYDNLDVAALVHDEEGELVLTVYLSVSVINRDHLKPH